MSRKMDTQISMLEIEKWASEKSLPVQFLMLLLAPLSSIAFEILSPIKKRVPHPFVTPPSKKDILLYRSPLSEHLVSLANSLSGLSKLTDNLSLFFLALSDRQPSEAQIVPRPYPALSIEEFILLLVEDIKEDINPISYTAVEKKDILKRFSTPEFSFLVRVALPCLFFYEESHNTLFQKAADGKKDALVKIIQLDKTTIQYSEINQWFSHYYLSENEHIYLQLVDSLKTAPPGKVSLKTIKYKIAGAIAFVTELIGHTLTEPEIRSFYNALTVDFDSEEVIDSDLPDSQEAFSKAIQREKKVWRDLLRRISTSPPPFS